MGDRSRLPPQLLRQSLSRLGGSTGMPHGDRRPPPLQRSGRSLFSTACRLGGRSPLTHEQSLTRLPLELLNGLPQIPAHELRVPIDPVQRARHHVLLCRVDRSGEGLHPRLHPIRSHSRLRWLPPCSLHHFVNHPAKKEGVGLL